MRLIGKLVALVCVLFVSCPAAIGAVRPHIALGVARFVSPTEFVGSGIAANLGCYAEAGTVSFTPTGNPAVLHVDGSTEYVAAGGAELHATIIGELNQQTGALTATLTYVGGTGRFEDASGSSVLRGQMQPDGSIRVIVIGRIDY